MVPVETRTGGVYSKTNHEIDFVLNRGFRRVYLQSAFRMDDSEKRERELLPLLKGETRGKKKNPRKHWHFCVFSGENEWWQGWESDPRHRDFQSPALPLSYLAEVRRPGPFGPHGVRVGEER